MISTWKKQFTLKQLSLHHENPIIFVISQWQKDCTPSIIYLVYRLFIAITFFTIWILSIIGINEPVDLDAASRAKWLIYLTDWGFTCCTLQAVLGACLVTCCIIADRRSKSNLQEKALKFYKVYWVLNTTALDLAIGITIVYWTILYKPNMGGADPMNILLHGFNSILMVTDFFLLSHPVKLLHCLYPLVLGLIYALFSVIYYLCGGTGREGRHFIYPILDWEKPGAAVLTCLGVMSFLVFLHIIIFLMFKIRQFVHSKIQGDPPTVQINLTTGVSTASTIYKGCDNEVLEKDIP